MKYCANCGKELIEGARFCAGCGAAMQQEPVYEASVPVAEDPSAEEQAFLDTTHRLLRWERKAWSIAGKAFIIFGAVFGGIFMLFALLFLALDEGEMAVLSGMYFVFSLIYGGMFIALGIVNKIAADKIDLYLNTIYTDASLAFDRCGSVGMLVFSVICGVISPIFFIINFARIKAGSKVIARILARQQGR